MIAEQIGLLTSGFRNSTTVQILRTDKPPSESWNLEFLWITEQIRGSELQVASGLLEYPFFIDTRADRAPPRLWTEVPRIQKTSGLQSSRRSWPQDIRNLHLGRYQGGQTALGILGSRILVDYGVLGSRWPQSCQNLGPVQMAEQIEQRESFQACGQLRTTKAAQPSPTFGASLLYYYCYCYSSLLNPLPLFLLPLALLALHLRPGLPERWHGSLVVVAHLAQSNAAEYGKLQWPFCTLKAHPHLLVWVTNERRVPTPVIINGSHWLEQF